LTPLWGIELLEVYEVSRDGKFFFEIVIHWIIYRRVYRGAVEPAAIVMAVTEKINPIRRLWSAEVSAAVGSLIILARFANCCSSTRLS